MKSFKQLRESKPSTEDSDINEVFNQAQMKKAIGIARKSRGNYDKAYAEIEKIKKGLGDEDIIAHVLKKANESVELDESKLGDDKGLLKLAKGPSSKFPMGVGGPDRDDLIWAADMIKHNDIKGIQSHLGMLDTPVRDAVLKFVDKNTKTKLGYRDITYESVELEEGFRVVGVTTSGEKFKTGLLKTKKDADNKHWKLTKATDLRGKKVYKTLEVVKESVELEEGVSLSKKGDYEVTADGKSSAGVMVNLRYKGKQIVTGTKVDGMFVMAFDTVDGNNKLPKGAKEIKKGKATHIGFKKVDDVIAYAKFGDITEAVSVDMRTKGYKEAIARGLVRSTKKEANAKKLAEKDKLAATIEDANKALSGKNEDMTAGGSASTGEIAGKDMPLKKKKTLKRFKET
jgi:hypothetical protein